MIVQEKPSTLTTATLGKSIYTIPNSNQYLDYRILRAKQNTNTGDPRAER